MLGFDTLSSLLLALLWIVLMVYVFFILPIGGKRFR